MRLLLVGLTFFLATSVVSSTTKAEDSVTQLTFTQWVCPEKPNTLSGRVILPSVAGKARAIPNARIALLSTDGKIIRGASDDSGNFEISNVQPGVYSMTAKAKNVFACCAMHVVDASSGKSAGFPSRVEIAAANIDFTVVKSSVIRYLPAKIKPMNLSIPTNELAAVSKLANNEQRFRVQQTNGGMKGQLHFAGAHDGVFDGANLTNVFVAKDGEAIDRTVTDEEGNFRIDSLPAGQYALLAVGPAGVGLVGFELVDKADANVPKHESSPLSEKDSAQLVSTFSDGSGCCDTFVMQVAPMPQVVGCCDTPIAMDSSMPMGPVPMNAPIVDGGCGCGSGMIVGDGQIVDGGVVMDGFGTPLDGTMIGPDGVMIGPDGSIIGGPGAGGFAPGGGFGGGFAPGGGLGAGGFGPGGGLGGGGFGGGGLGAAGGGLGGIAGLAAVGGIIAATTTSNNDNPQFIPVTTTPDASSPQQ